MLTLTEINIFPIKSLGGIRCQSAQLQEHGFQHDRRLMLVDIEGNFLSQRTMPQLSQLEVSLQGNQLQVQNRSRSKDAALAIPTSPNSKKTQTVQIWSDQCQAGVYSDTVNRWFSDQIGTECRLVGMSDDFTRPVDPEFAKENQQVSFADGFPTMIIGEGSLDDLNEKLEAKGEKAVPMDRFRTNLVFEGGAPFAEDSWKRIRIGSAEFAVSKPCARCVMTTVDPLTSKTGLEPLRTLATYRNQERGVMFGQNLLHLVEGQVSVGDEVVVLE